MIITVKDSVWRAVALACIVVTTIFVLKQGTVSGNGSAVQKSTAGHNSDAFKYRKVSRPKYKGRKEKAAFVTLAQDKDLYSLLGSIASVEDRFNGKFNYDWVFLNDKEFSDEFKRCLLYTSRCV